MLGPGSQTIKTNVFADYLRTLRLRYEKESNQNTVHALEYFTDSDSSELNVESWKALSVRTRHVGANNT
jgi:hypothetical protein